MQRGWIICLKLCTQLTSGRAGIQTLAPGCMLLTSMLARRIIESAKVARRDFLEEVHSTVIWRISRSFSTDEWGQRVGQTSRLRRQCVVSWGWLCARSWKMGLLCCAKEISFSPFSFWKHSGQCGEPSRSSFRIQGLISLAAWGAEDWLSQLTLCLELPLTKGAAMPKIMCPSWASHSQSMIDPWVQRPGTITPTQGRSGGTSHLRTPDRVSQGFCWGCVKTQHLLCPVLLPSVLPKCWSSEHIPISLLHEHLCRRVNVQRTQTFRQEITEELWAEIRHSLIWVLS